MQMVGQLFDELRPKVKGSLPGLVGSMVRSKSLHCVRRISLAWSLSLSIVLLCLNGMLCISSWFTAISDHNWFLTRNEPIPGTTEPLCGGLSHQVANKFLPRRLSRLFWRWECGHQTKRIMTGIVLGMARTSCLKYSWMENINRINWVFVS